MATAALAAPWRGHGGRASRAAPASLRAEDPAFRNVRRLARRLGHGGEALLFRRLADGDFVLAHARRVPPPPVLQRWHAMLPRLLAAGTASRGLAPPQPVACLAAIPGLDRRVAGALALLGDAPIPQGDGELLAEAAASAIRAHAESAEQADLEGRLRLRLYRLHTLFDLSRTLGATFRSGHVARALATTLMGLLMVGRVGILQPGSTKGTKRTRLHLFPYGGSAGRRRAQGLSWGDVEAAARRGRPLPGTAVARVLGGLGLVRLYPLEAGGQTIGAVALARKTTRAAFTEEDDEFARTLVNHTALALSNARLLRESVERRRITRELEFARTIQKAILPSEAVERHGVSICGEALPCHEVGGDYFDVVPLAGDQLLVAAGDVSGKGVPAAILMASVAATVRALAAGTPPGRPGALKRLVARVNAQLCHATSAGRFVSLLLLTVNARTGRVRYVNAGHNPGIHVSRRTALLPAGGTPLGLFPESTYEEGAFTLGRGEAILLYTDGVSETFEDEAAEPALAAWIRPRLPGPAPVLLRHALGELSRRVGDTPPSDDMTLVCVARRP